MLTPLRPATRSAMALRRPAALAQSPSSVRPRAARALFQHFGRPHAPVMSGSQCADRPAAASGACRGRVTDRDRRHFQPSQAGFSVNATVYRVSDGVRWDTGECPSSLQLGTVTTPELPTQYAPADVETRSYERWVAEGYFSADAGSEREPFTIVLP
ncbi:hypothetical protein, partial [Sphaerisporangium melleum]|uniref:hypothetical protein n=1 Tax=Sphaerisporangium melleum TaxID=321316 RepID=UPI0027E3C023